MWIRAYFSRLNGVNMKDYDGISEHLSRTKQRFNDSSDTKYSELGRIETTW